MRKKMRPKLPAFAIHQHIAGLHIPMDNVPRMNVLRGIQQLVHHETLVNVLQN